MAKINRCPFDDGGLIGPTTSIPHISNGQVEVVGVKIPRCLMDEIAMHLAGVTSFGIGDGVSDHLRPIISQPLESIRMFWARLMGSTHTVMDFFQYLMCLFLR